LQDLNGNCPALWGEKRGKDLFGTVKTRLKGSPWGEGRGGKGGKPLGRNFTKIWVVRPCSEEGKRGT